MYVLITVIEINATLVNAKWRTDYFQLKVINEKERVAFQRGGNLDGWRLIFSTFDDWRLLEFRALDSLCY